MVGATRRRRTTAWAAFALLALVAELTGRSITARIDRALHVAPLAAQNATYYPLLLVVVKIAAALALGWGAVRRWFADVERYAAATLSRARRILRAAALPVRRDRARDDRGPR